MPIETLANEVISSAYVDFHGNSKSRTQQKAIADHVRPFLEKLPREIYDMITSYLKPLDYMRLKLSCRMMNSHLDQSLQTFIAKNCKAEIAKRQRRKIGHPFREHRFGHGHFFDNVSAGIARVISTHMSLEPYFVEKGKLSSLICTVCGKIRDLEFFIDFDRRASTRRKFRDTRTCIECGVNSFSKHLSSRKSVKYNGKECFICFLCYQALPLTELHNGERVKSASKLSIGAANKSKFCWRCAAKTNQEHPGLFGQSETTA